MPVVKETIPKMATQPRNQYSQIEGYHGKWLIWLVFYREHWLIGQLQSIIRVHLCLSWSQIPWTHTVHHIHCTVYHKPRYIAHVRAKGLGRVFEGHMCHNNRASVISSIQSGSYPMQDGRLLLWWCQGQVVVVHGSVCSVVWDFLFSCCGHANRTLAVGALISGWDSVCNI